MSKFALVQHRDTFSQRMLQKSKESNNGKKKLRLNLFYKLNKDS